MSRFPADMISVVAAGKRMVVGNTQNTASLPTDAGGRTASCVLISAAAEAWIRFGIATAVESSTSTAIRISPNHPHVFNTRGLSYIATLADTTTYLSIVAVEIG